MEARSSTFSCALWLVYGEGMEVDRFDHHAPLGRHHRGSDRRIDPAGQKGQTLAVGSQRQTTESSDLILVNIRFIVLERPQTEDSPDDAHPL